MGLLGKAKWKAEVAARAAIDKQAAKGGKGDIVSVEHAKPLTVKKDGGDVDAISGSTITSRAFLTAVNDAYAIFTKINA